MRKQFFCQSPGPTKSTVISKQVPARLDCALAGFGVQFRGISVQLCVYFETFKQSKLDRL